MKRYLLHLTPSGYPLGIHSDTESVYLEENAASRYGTAVVRSRGSETTWEQYCAQLAEQGQSRALWHPFWSSRSDLREILIEQQASAQYSIN